MYSCNDYLQHKYRLTYRSFPSDETTSLCVVVVQKSNIQSLTKPSTVSSRTSCTYHYFHNEVMFIE
jgi:hypothetical protein